MVGFAAAVDSHVPEVIAVATIVFVVAVVNITGSLVRTTLRRAQPRDELLGPLGVLAILGFVAVVVGVSLPISFALKARQSRTRRPGVSWPVLSSWSPASHFSRGC